MSATSSSSLISGTTNTGLSSAASSALSSSATSSTGTTALTSLTSNYSDFLNMLMTQVKNQDPTSPMDTSSFTTELVQFSSVEQQINTNTSLTQLIQLTQSGEMLQSSSMVGHTVAVAKSDMPVQSGSGEIQFTAASAGSAQVAVYNSAGTLLSDSLVNTTQGVNTWKWNAQNSSGTTQPDGSYKVVVTGTDSTGATSSLPFNVVGVATGVTKSGTTLELQMGQVTTDFSNVQSVLN